MLVAGSDRAKCSRHGFGGLCGERHTRRVSTTASTLHYIKYTHRDISIRISRCRKDLTGDELIHFFIAISASLWATMIKQERSRQMILGTGAAL